MDRKEGLAQNAGQRRLAEMLLKFRTAAFNPKKQSLAWQLWGSLKDFVSSEHQSMIKIGWGVAKKGESSLQLDTFLNMVRKHHGIPEEPVGS